MAYNRKSNYGINYSSFGIYPRYLSGDTVSRMHKMSEFDSFGRNSTLIFAGDSISDEGDSTETNKWGGDGNIICADGGGEPDFRKGWYWPLTLRHSNRGNVCMLDGHVESLLGAQIFSGYKYYMPFSYGDGGALQFRPEADN